MCSSKITIRNKSKLYRPGKDRVYIDVPCGHCDQCVNRYRDEWFVRSMREMTYTKEIGGMTLMVLLTYASDKVPVYTDGEHSFDCFSHEHILSFMKRIRAKFAHKGITRDMFKYIVCCEYGEDKDRTRRPHYHVLFHF